MHSYENQGTRVAIESSRYESGRLLVTVTGMAGERFTDVPWEEPFGFHSRPSSGSVGFLSAPGGRRDQAVVRAAHDPAKVPQVGEGEAVMYRDGAFVKLTEAGLVISHGTGITLEGPVTISGNLTVDGALHATGDISSDSPDATDE